jgi:mannose-6-phosphate isomerase-like protein (cupin superfamily)
MAWGTMRLPAEPTVVAPDGSDVRVLLGLAGGGMAHFELGPGQTSKAVVHRTVEEIWYCLRGRGQMWRRREDREETVDVGAGTCLTIPVGTRFQFRCLGAEPLSAIAITMPPWPGEHEAQPTSGPWIPTKT